MSYDPSTQLTHGAFYHSCIRFIVMWLSNKVFTVITIRKTKWLKKTDHHHHPNESRPRQGLGGWERRQTNTLITRRSTKENSRTSNMYIRRNTSMAAALHRSKVTRSWCCFWTTGRIAAVYTRHEYLNLVNTSHQNTASNMLEYKQLNVMI